MDKQEFIEWLEGQLAAAKNDLARAKAEYNRTGSEPDRRTAAMFQSQVWTLAEVLHKARQLNETPVSPVADVNEGYQP